MSREVPEGWSLERLGDVCEIGGGVGFKEAMQGRRDLPFPFIKVSDMNDPGNEIEIRSARNYVDSAMLKAMGAKLFPVGAVVLPKVGAAALTNKRRQLAKPTAVDNNLMVWTPSSIDPSFLLHWSRTIDVALLVQTGALPSLNKTIAENIPLILPPLHEQRRIAEILSSVDEAIAATRAVIEQTRKVKLSTLGMLFHRGNWTEAELPAGHRLVKLEDIARRGSGHTPSKRFSEYWGGGVPWVSLQDTKALDRRHIKNTAANISDLGIKNSSAEVHPAGTVFVSRDATVGRVGVMQIPMAVSQHFISWTCGPKLDHLFLYYWLLNMKPVLERIAAGSTIKTIGLPFFKELEIALPEMTTQKRIVSQMMSLDDALDSNEVSLVALTTLKSALMSDLFTGRKRVPDVVPMAAE